MTLSCAMLPRVSTGYLLGGLRTVLMGRHTNDFERRDKSYLSPPLPRRKIVAEPISCCFHIGPAEKLQGVMAYFHFCLLSKLEFGSTGADQILAALSLPHFPLVTTAALLFPIRKGRGCKYTNTPAASCPLSQKGLKKLYLQAQPKMRCLWSIHNCLHLFAGVAHLCLLSSAGVCEQRYGKWYWVGLWSTSARQTWGNHRSVCNMLPMCSCRWCRYVSRQRKEEGTVDERCNGSFCVDKLKERNQKWCLTKLTHSLTHSMRGGKN